MKLKLSPEDREALLFQLLTSLTNNKEIDEAWAIETERRIADIDNNRTSVIPLDEALAHGILAVAHHRRFPGYWQNR